MVEPDKPKKKKKQADKEHEYPTSSKKYKLIGPIGCGSFGIVWKAKILTGRHKEQYCAIKIIDLDKFEDSSIEEMRREISIMSQCSHRNVVNYHVAFIKNNEVWLVMPILEGGSVFDIMRYRHQEGLEDEHIIATILKETLLGLQYFHNAHQIHRDIKCGNILLDAEGHVFIADFGVATKLKEGRKRNTFVGSPCWMAPEVISQAGYDFKADIWSFGITAIEIAEGHAPYSASPPMKVIVSILQNEAPKLGKAKLWDYSFYQLVEACLCKDPKSRPTCEDLFKKHRTFFSKAKNAAYIKSKLLNDLPELEERIDPSIHLMAEEILQSKSNVVKQVAPEIVWNFDTSPQSIKYKPEHLAETEELISELADIIGEDEGGEDDDEDDVYLAAESPTQKLSIDEPKKKSNISLQKKEFKGDDMDELDFPEDEDAFA